MTSPTLRYQASFALALGLHVGGLWALLPSIQDQLLLLMQEAIPASAIEVALQPPEPALEPVPIALPAQSSLNLKTSLGTEVISAGAGQPFTAIAPQPPGAMALSSSLHEVHPRPPERPPADLPPVYATLADYFLPPVFAAELAPTLELAMAEPALLPVYTRPRRRLSPQPTAAPFQPVEEARVEVPDPAPEAPSESLSEPLPEPLSLIETEPLPELVVAPPTEPVSTREFLQALNDALAEPTEQAPGDPAADGPPVEIIPGLLGAPDRGPGSYTANGNEFFSALTSQLFMNNQRALAGAIRAGPRVAIDVRFIMQRDGRVLGAEVVRSSGLAPLDDTAVQTILAASPLPQVPADMLQDRLELSFPVEVYR